MVGLGTKRKGNMNAQGKIVRGVLSTLAGALSWGFSGTCMQFLFSSTSLDPLLITAIRQLGAGLVFVAYLCARRPDSLKNLFADAQDRRELLIFGAFGLFLNSFLYAATVGATNAGTATVLQSLNIVMVLALSCARHRRAPRPLELLALGCASLAVYLISTGGDPTALRLPLNGLLLGVGTAAASVFYTTYPRRLMDRHGSFAVTGVGMLVAGITAWLVWLVSGGPARGLPAANATTVLVLAVTVLVGTFAAYGLFLHGISLVGPVAGNMLGAAEPVSATVISAVWLGTAFAWSDWVGLVLMVATIMLVAWDSARASDTGGGQG